MSGSGLRDPLPKGADRRPQGELQAPVNRASANWLDENGTSPTEWPPGRSGYGVVAAKRQETGK
jgi:hypothetical protein